VCFFFWVGFVLCFFSFFCCLWLVVCCCFGVGWVFDLVFCFVGLL